MANWDWQNYVVYESFAQSSIEQICNTSFFFLFTYLCSYQAQTLTYI